MRTLLLADDSLTVQRVIALTFAAEPFQVVAVSDGRQAMEKMAAARPDIVLAGTTLPHVDGYELAAFMRSKRELQKVPVLLLAGAFEAVDQARLASSGAAGWIEKPVDPTTVISRVKELLGLKSDGGPSGSTGRVLTSIDAGDKKLPTAAAPRAATTAARPPSTWDQLRSQTGLDANTRSVEDSSSRPDDYLGSLDDAFDTLDRQLSGREPAARAPRNPAGPLGPSSSTVDPRSPGRRPPVDTGSETPVFEVDDEWFGGKDAAAEAGARADRQEIADDLRNADWRPAADAPPAHSIYEVDEGWFADGENARAARAMQEKQLADDMGIHDVDLPPRETESKPPIDLDLGIDDLHRLEPAAIEAPAAAAPSLPSPVAPVPKPAPVPAVVVPPQAPVATVAPQPAPVSPASAAPVAAPPPVTVADDFADLLAYEQGEKAAPPAVVMPPPEVRVVSPEITTEMLDEIATRVADRLNAGPFAEALRNSMTSTVRDTVRAVVSETSERLVREEIDRIKNKKI